MRRRSLLKGLVAAAVGAAAHRFRPAAGSRVGLSRQALRLRAGGWRLGPHELLRPQGQHPGEPVINHWAERDEVRQAGGIPYAPFARNAAFFDKYHRPDAGHQRGGRADELAHGGHRAQLERAQLRGVPDAHRAARRALCAGVAGSVPELRGVLGDLGPHPLHPHQRCGPAALHRHPANPKGSTRRSRWRIEANGVVSGGHRGAS